MFTGQFYQLMSLSGNLQPDPSALRSRLPLNIHQLLIFRAATLRAWQANPVKSSTVEDQDKEDYGPARKTPLSELAS